MIPWFVEGKEKEKPGHWQEVAKLSYPTQKKKSDLSRMIDTSIPALLS